MCPIDPSIYAARDRWIAEYHTARQQVEELAYWLRLAANGPLGSEGREAVKRLLERCK